MGTTLELQTLLENLLGSENVYFQPPATIQMAYPAIKYSRESIDNKHADDAVYKQSYAYQVIVIDRDPDSSIVGKVSKLPMCRFSRNYKADNLNHDVFKLYF